MADHPYELARKHLSRTDPAFRPLIKQVGPCTLQPNPDSFSVLARSIISQQISTKAAQSISGRLVELCGRAGLKAKRLAALSDEQLRGCGISTNKRLSLRSLSEHFLDDKKLRGDLNLLSDEEIHDHLIPIRGIGVWTVHMFLIFSLGRLDVLPIGDLGLRSAVQNLFAMDETPHPTAITEMAEPWRPYRTVATWYLWRSKGAVPQSK
jgi:DNA-3-methyladenine glycosylase II